MSIQKAIDSSWMSWIRIVSFLQCQPPTHTHLSYVLVNKTPLCLRNIMVLWYFPSKKVFFFFSNFWPCSPNSVLFLLPFRSIFPPKSLHGQALAKPWLCRYTVSEVVPTFHSTLQYTIHVFKCGFQAPDIYK